MKVRFFYIQRRYRVITDSGKGLTQLQVWGMKKSQIHVLLSKK